MALSGDLRFHGEFLYWVDRGAFLWDSFRMVSLVRIDFYVADLGGDSPSGFATMQSAITMLSTPHDMRGRMMGLLSVFIGVGTP
ncbi:MAG: hypothetical protein Ct9H300mP11_18770 [Chloroflexota bacterium]|nr:MAG: hypothetical protein Ct9H300mP11_18770 [Chloroflexota bacterium]